MQLQYMRMLDQFQNGNLPLNLVGDKKGRKQKGIERRKDTLADEGGRTTVQTDADLAYNRRHLDMFL